MNAIYSLLILATVIVTNKGMEETETLVCKSLSSLDYKDPKPHKIKSLKRALRDADDTSTAQALQNGADPNKKYSDHFTIMYPLFFTAQTVFAIDLCIANKANLNFTDSNHNTFLHYLITHWTDKTEKLLTHCLTKTELVRHIDTPNDQGNTPLHSACDPTGLLLKNINPVIIKILLEHNANKDKINCDGKTPKELLENNQDAYFICNHKESPAIKAALELLQKDRKN